MLLQWLTSRVARLGTCHHVHHGNVLRCIPPGRKKQDGNQGWFFGRYGTTDLATCRHALNAMFDCWVRNRNARLEVCETCAIRLPDLSLRPQCYPRLLSFEKRVFEKGEQTRFPEHCRSINKQAAQQVHGRPTSRITCPKVSSFI